MSKQELEEFRRMLLDKRREIMGSLDDMQDEVEDENQTQQVHMSSMPTHPADIGTEAYSQDLSLHLMQRERDLLIEVDEALRRIEDGTYGVCLATGKPIGKQRLQAKPWARFCLEYARQQEK